MPRKPAGPGESEPARYRREAARLRPLEDAVPILSEMSVRDYLSTLGAVFHAAHHGVNRPATPNEAPDYLRDKRDPGSRAGVAGSKRTSGEWANGTSRPVSESKPPSYSAQAMALLNAERRHLAQREKRLMSMLDSIVGER